MVATGKTELFVDRLALYGDAVALTLDGRVSVTYADLSAPVDEFARRFGQQRCLVLLEPELSIESIVAYLAALKARCPVILAAPDREGANDDIAETFQVDVIVKSDGTIRRLESSSTKVPSALHPDLAVLLSTSGSTGSGKFVRLSHRNIESNAESIAAYLELTPADVGALTLPLHYSYGLSILNSHLFAGAGICIWSLAPTDPAILEWFDAAGCTNISGVPYSYEIFERIGLRNRTLRSLRFMTAAGGRLPKNVVRLYADYLKKRNGKFFVMYGQTEASPRISYLPPEAASEYAECIGIAIPKGELFLIDECGNRIEKPHTPGELVYRGPNVMMGYGTTAEDLGRGPELDELQTGDLAERNERGFFRIVGRKSRFSKLSGFRVSHDDVERQLHAVGTSAIVSGTDERLIVALTDHTDPDDAVRHIINFSNIKPGQIKVVRLREVPQLSSGKIDYRAITRMLSDDRSGAASPSTVLDAFSRAFWPRRVTPTDSFVSLSGDSLTFVQLTVALESILGWLPRNWENMRISEISADAATDTEGSRVEPNVYIRAVAILLVVMNHLAGWGIQAGAYVLMSMVGYNLARFQTPALFAGRSSGIFKQLTRNLILYYIVLAFLFVQDGAFRWPETFLVSNIIAPATWRAPLAFNAYWFIESYAQIILILALMCAIPYLRKRIAGHPFGFGIAALLISLAFIYLGRVTWELSWNTCSQRACEPVTETAYWAVIGWCLYFARTQWSKVAAVILACAAILTVERAVYAHWDARILPYGGVFCLLAWNERLRVGSFVALALAYIAVNSYIIYLFHLIPMTVFGSDVPLVNVSDSAKDMIRVIMGIGFALLVARILHLVERFFRNSRMPQFGLRMLDSNTLGEP